MFCEVLRVKTKISVEVKMTIKTRYSGVNIKPLAIPKLAKAKNAPLKIAKLIL